MLSPELEIKSWGVDFSMRYPYHVCSVKPNGHVAAWNEMQDTVQNLVRQGDTLLQIAFAGITVKANGRSPSEVVQQVFREYLVRHSGELPVPTDPPEVADLFFGGMRSLTPLRVQDEIGVLQSTGCDFQAHAATAENTRALISGNECRILHFSFHTSSDQSHRVFLEDIYGKAHVLTIQEFQTLLSRDGDPKRLHHISLVFISSCHSFSLGQHIAEAGVRHVICVHDDNHSVLDSSCRLFASHFYRALGAGGSVQHAFTCGVIALETSPIKGVKDDGRKFVLLPRDVDHEEVLAPCSTPLAAATSAHVPSIVWGSIPARAEDFVGREVDVYRLCVVLRSNSHNSYEGRRLVLLCGDEGIGKTALMAEVGHFVQSRHDLFDEVRWLAACSTERSTVKDQLSAESEAGLKDLRTRLLTSSRWRTLLLIDNHSMMSWEPIQQLLLMPSVHAIVAVTSPDVNMAELDTTAMVVGVKPVRYLLGPPDPISQARLFLGRAPRELYKCEVLHDAPSTYDSCGVLSSVWRPQRPVDYLVLADSKLVRSHHGNPRQILVAAQALAPIVLAPADSEELGKTDAESSRSSISMCPNRKVRLLMPSGQQVCEWLPAGMLMRDLLKERSPKGCPGGIDIFIEGCLVQPDMSLAEFADANTCDVITLELRKRVCDDTEMGDSLFHIPEKLQKQVTY
jgi:hypothetical protein